MKARVISHIAAATFCVFLVPSLAAQDTFNHPRIITVMGTAEVKVVPDEVILTLGADSHDKDLAVAKLDNDKRIKMLIGLARTAGVEMKNIQTSALTLEPEYSEERIPKLLGYQVSQVITITLTDLSKYEDLMTNSFIAGVNRVDGINFAVADEKKYKEEARIKAVRAAREKAIAMAAELGQTIGKPWEVIELVEGGGGGVTANNSFREKSAGQQEELTVAGGEVTIRAVVRVSFMLE